MDKIRRYELAEETRQRMREGAALDDLLANIRAQGAGKIDTIAVLHEAIGMDLAEAKRAVHFSTVWSDVKERDERFWDELTQDCGSLETPESSG